MVELELEKDGFYIFSLIMVRNLLPHERSYIDSNNDMFVNLPIRKV